MEPSDLIPHRTFGFPLRSPALVSGFLLLVGFVLSGSQLQRTKPNHPRELISPPAELQHFQFGFRSASADLLWVRAIQDFDYCETPLAKNLCRGQSWLFHVLDLVTDLDPHFRMAYSAGGMALSVIISDVDGATRLFDKATQAFPKDWVIAYKAAYHALYEEKDKAKAARLMRIAAENGAPDWVFVLSGRLATDAGQRDFAEQILQEMKSLGLDEKMQERLRQKIEEK